jgi:hypothetical protein
VLSKRKRRRGQVFAASASLTCVVVVLLALAVCVKSARAVCVCRSSREPGVVRVTCERLERRRRARLHGASSSASLSERARE